MVTGKAAAVVREEPASGMRSISILGATGSIGASTVDLIKRNRDRYRVETVAAGRNAAALAKVAREVGAKLAVVSDETAYAELKDALGGSGIEAAAGETALVEGATRPADWVMASIAGAIGLRPTLAAIEAGMTVALANKECLVCAGGLFMRRAKATGATVLPVDSEHNAIFQCLSGADLADVRWITLTASGGPFRDWPAERLALATPAEAVKHPNWSMGAKISVDSATMMNKGLEFIEAYHLFPVGTERLRIIVHPQSIVHSMVEYRDGSTLAQLGPSDMRVPIASALAWPARMDTPCAPLDLAAIGELSFRAPDEVRFPATRIARHAAAAGGGVPAVLNAANEVAVAAFLAGKLAFTHIAAQVEETLGRFAPSSPSTLDEVIAIDAEARARARELLELA